MNVKVGMAGSFVAVYRVRGVVALTADENDTRTMRRRMEAGPKWLGRGRGAMCVSIADDASAA